MNLCLYLPSSASFRAPTQTMFLPHCTQHKEALQRTWIWSPAPPPLAPYAQCSHRLRPLICNVGIHHLLFGLVTGIEQEGRCQHACGCLWLPSLVGESLALSHHPLTRIFEHLLLYETLQQVPRIERDKRKRSLLYHRLFETLHLKIARVEGIGRWRQILGLCPPTNTTI